MATRKQASMCCVSIGYQDFLLPTDKGLSVVELLKDAVPCTKRFDDGQYYTTRPQTLELGVTIVSSAQVRNEANQATATPALANHD